MIETEAGVDTSLSPHAIRAAKPDTSAISVSEARPAAVEPVVAPLSLRMTQ